jgi:L-amino acid N-acyltransferase YncA
MTLRPSQEADLPAISRIYSHYVLHTTATFELEPPDTAEMAKRRTTILDRHLPYYVLDASGTIVGYAYATMYRPRGGYRFTVEDSIYLHPEYGGKGYGKLLLGAVIRDCEAAGYRQMIAVIGGSDNAPSIGLHRALGFKDAGVLWGAGYKFERWVDSVLMQRQLGAGTAARPLEIDTPV